jgi:hypothetical protein
LWLEHIKRNSDDQVAGLMQRANPAERVGKTIAALSHLVQEIVEFEIALLAARVRFGAPDPCFDVSSRFAYRSERGRHQVGVGQDIRAEMKSENAREALDIRQFDFDGAVQPSRSPYRRIDTVGVIRRCHDKNARPIFDA